MDKLLAVGGAHLQRGRTALQGLNRATTGQGVRSAENTHTHKVPLKKSVEKCGHAHVWNTRRQCAGRGLLALRFLVRPKGLHI